MADDIDIEEHDVLESLRRRRAPDVADAAEGPDVVVKSEPLEIEYEESNYEAPGNFAYQWDWDKDHAPEIKVEPYTEEPFRFGKIILGSKPADPQEDKEAESSKDDQENYNYNMSLVLDDWGPMLKRSDCYCKDCEILFATVNALDAHKMIAHSFLVATDEQPFPERNKAIKSTAKPSNSDDKQTCQICQYHFKGASGRFNLVRHYKQVHQVDPNTLGNHKDLKGWKICNHCSMYFPDDTSLVKHLYELLPINNKTPTKDDKKSVGPSSVKAKPVLNIDKSNTKSNKDVKSTNVKINVASNDKDKNPLPNRIILGSKPETVNSETITKHDKPRPRKCEICAIEYNRKYYMQHMKKFHQEYLIKRLMRPPDKKQPEKIVLNNTRVRFKCGVCNEILTSNYAVRKHRLKHPGSKGTRFISKIVKLNKIHKVKMKPSLVMKEPLTVYPSKTANMVNLKKEPINENKGILVSKSTLFKCNRCSVHFLTCTGACQHSIVCETSSNIRDWACPKCQRVFKSVEKSAHEYQHKVMNANKFKVYVVYLEMIVRILCECPDCFVCFEEDKFARHISGGCHDAASYYCSECRLSIDIHSQANHDSKHKQGDFKKDDFIKIDYVSSKQDFTQKKIKTEFVLDSISPVKRIKTTDEPKKGLKRKLDVSVPHPRKRSKLSDALHLFYCSACKSYLGTKLGFHLSGKCKGKKITQRHLCKVCGIYFRSVYYKSHVGLHEKNPNLALSDFTFTRMTDSKKIKPMPELHQCKRCKVNFLTKKARIIHKCEQTHSTNCQICQKRVQNDVFKLHMQIHNYVIPSEIKSIHELTPKKAPNPSRISRKETKSPMTKLPDLLMKYQSLTALWNILYLCATCDTFTDSYDKVVEHCQNHLTNMENYGVVIMKCQICDMKFDKECYKRHVELHAGSKVINKKTFQILKYDYEQLFSDQWFDLLDLPEEQKSQIVSRSIYGANRCVKMRLIQQGPPEYTLYKCSKCLNCVAADSIVYHVKLTQCVKANKIACSICDMTFSIRGQCDEHERVHETTGLGLQSFRIVAFNDTDDTDSNTKIMSFDTENHGNRSKISFADTDDETSKSVELGENNGNGKSFVLYKCAECHSCLLHIKNFPRHVCNKNSLKKECDKCGLLFNAKNYPAHQKLHNRYAFSRKNIITKTLNKEGKVINIKKQSQEKIVRSTQHTLNDAAQKSNLYKCYCGLHYTSVKTIEKHYKMKNCGTVIREKCSQCNLVFDPIEVVNHLCKHHAQNHVKSFNIITPKKKTLFKCGLCHVLFYNKTAAMPHQAKCAGKFCGKKCEKCGLAFDTTSIETHMVDHQRNNKLRTDCYVIVKIPDEKMTEYTNNSNDKVVSPNVLYKSKCCNIHFLRRTSARNHLSRRTDCNMTATQICEICNLEFPSKSMRKHVGWQHNTMNVKEFTIIEIIVGVNTKVLKGDRSEAMLKPKAMKQMEKPVVPKAQPVNVTVFRCIKCMVHFIDENGLVNHLEDRCSKELTEECEDCAVKFASRNIKEHKKHHGAGIALTMDIIEDVEISPIRDEVKIEKYRAYEPKPKEFSLDRYDNKLYRCTECNFHYNTHSTLVKHRDVCNLRAEGLKCDACNICWFTKYSLRRHRLIHEKYNFTKDDFVVLTLADGDVSRVESNQGDVETKGEQDDVSIDSSFELESTEKSNPGKSKEQKKVNTNIHYLYKCADCNVYFGTQKTCHKHITNHMPLDPKEYIECKLCGFQFTIMGLQPHIKKYHEKLFNLEETLVEEYQPNDINAKETYYASEKDQSRLVSTSDDVKNVSNLKKENDCEVTSCNEITEKVDSTDEGQVNNTDVTDDKTEVSHQATDDLNLINDPSASSVPSTDAIDSTGNGQVNTTDVTDDKTEVSHQATDDLNLINDPSASSVPSTDAIDSTGNGQVNTTDVTDDKTEVSHQATDDLNLITDPSASSVPATDAIDSTGNGQVNTTDVTDDKTEVSHQATDDLNLINDPSASSVPATDAIDSTGNGQVNTTDVTDDKTEVSHQATDDLNIITDPSASSVPATDTIVNNEQDDKCIS